VTVQREASADGSVKLSAGRCTFTFTRPAPGMVDVRIEGTDKGQFGTAALDEIALAIVRERPIYSDPALFEARKSKS